MDRNTENRRKAYQEVYKEIFCSSGTEAELTVSDLLSDGFTRGTRKGAEHEYTKYYDDTEHVTRIAVFYEGTTGTEPYIIGG